MMEECECNNDTTVDLSAVDSLLAANSFFANAIFAGLNFASQPQGSQQDNPACDAGKDIVHKLVLFEVISFTFFLFSTLLALGLKIAFTLINCNAMDNVRMDRRSKIACLREEINRIRTEISTADTDTLQEEILSLQAIHTADIVTLQAEIRTLRSEIRTAGILTLQEEMCKLRFDILCIENTVQKMFRVRFPKGKLCCGLVASAILSGLGCFFLVLSIVDIIQINLGLLSCGSIAADRALATAFLLILSPCALLLYMNTVYCGLTY